MRKLSTNDNECCQKCQKCGELKTNDNKCCQNRREMKTIDDECCQNRREVKTDGQVKLNEDKLKQAA